MRLTQVTSFPPHNIQSTKDTHNSSSVLPTENEPTVINLKNGIKIIAEEMPGAISCAMSIWVKTGSVNENIKNNGISHFIEHMMFKGTEKRSALDISKESESVGANLNAFTSQELTCYYTKVLGEHAMVPLEILLDMVFNSKLDDTELTNEKKVVLEEIKMYEDKPNNSAIKLAYSTLWNKHPLGRPIIGTNETVSGLSKDRIRQYLNDFYTPSNMVISIAGKFNIDDVVKLVVNSTPKTKTKTKEVKLPVLSTNSDVVIQNKDINQAHLALVTKGISINDERKFTLAITEEILGGGMSSRLFQEVREKRGLAYTISSFSDSFKAGGLSGVYAGTSIKDSKLALGLILDELNKMKTDGVQDEELKKAKVNLKSSILMNLESTAGRAERNAEQNIYYNKFFSTKAVSQFIESVTNKDITELTRELFNPKHFTLAVVGNKKKLPKNIEL